MDALSEVLKVVKLQGALLGTSIDDPH